MMLFYNNNNSVGQIRDEEFVRLGKKHGVVTMNDCAADVPPVENLWKFTGWASTSSRSPAARASAGRRAPACSSAARI